MSDKCLSCRDRPQTGAFGLCDQCRDERRERVRDSLRDDGDDEQTGGQSSLGDF